MVRIITTEEAKKLFKEAYSIGDASWTLCDSQEDEGSVLDLKRF